MLLGAFGKQFMLSKVVFLCSSNKSTGFGHVSRCLNIALEIIEIAPLSQIYFCGEYLSFAKNSIMDSGFLCVNSTSSIGLDHGTVLVVDDYNIKKSELFNHKSYGCRIVVIDDFDQFAFSCVDMIVNFRFESEVRDSNGDNKALGLKYFPFKSTFRELRDERLKRVDKVDDIHTILLFIGGSDVGTSASKVLACLDKIFVDKKIVWLSDDNSNNVMKNNTLLKKSFVKDMTLLYSQADALICGGGLSKYESGFCLLPNAAISQNDGQQQDTNILAKYHLSFDLGLADAIDDNSLCDRLRKFFEPENLRLQKLAMSSEYDRDSTNRVSQLIVNE